MLSTNQQIEELNTECVELREKVEASRTQLRLTNRTLHDITNENQHLKTKCGLSKVKIDKLKTKNERLERECVRLEIENFDLRNNHVILIPAFKLMISSQLFKILLDIASIPLR